MISVLMVGVGKKRVGGMNSVAEMYKTNPEYNKEVDLKYISTSTNGSKLARFIYMIVGYVRILFHLLFRKTDIVHIHMAEKGSTFRKGFVAKVSKKMNKKVIIHLHAGPFMNWYSALDPAKQQKVTNIFKTADIVIALGEYWKEQLSAIVPKGKIIVIYNGTKIPEKNPYNKNSINITYFGVLRKEKGTYDLLNAIKIIDGKLDKKIKVLLCGNDLEGDFAEKIKKLKLQNRVQMLGWVNDKQQKELLKSSIINILPSYYEGLSMSIIEGMAYGIPTITTNISTMPELLGDYEYLIKPGDINGLSDSILRLAKNSKERSTISEYEYSRANNLFSEGKFIHNTLMLYNKVMGKTS